MNILFDFGKSSLYFENPVSIIDCSSFKDVAQAFENIEEALAQGLYVAGFFSYELGYAFEEKFSSYQQNGFPLIRVGCYKKSQPYKDQLVADGHEGETQNVRFNISQEKYFEHIDIIRSYLQSGDVYQITYCLKILFDFNGNAFDLYKKLFDIQPVPYAAYIETDQYSIASLSPELFLYKSGDSILSKPMKGT